MIANLQPYPAYKDSGVSWLGDVPNHWEVRRLGQIGRLSKGNGGTKDDEEDTGVPCVRYGDLYTTHNYFVLKSRSFVTPESAEDYTPIVFGDILFAASGETIDEIGKSAVNLMHSEACCGGDVILFRPERELVARYMGYATDCYPAASQKSTMGRGITVKHIYGDQLKYLTVGLPPLAEQAAIVRYLDYVDRRVRRYVRAKQRLIELLNEQKQAVIKQAVTRGLDPTVKLKPSGIDWLGDIPEHWEVRRVKQVSQILRGKFTHRPRNDPSLYDGVYPFIQTGEVARATKTITTYSQTLNERGLAVSKLFPAGTLLMTIAANIGDVAVLDIEACFPDSVVGFVPEDTVDRDYLYYVFRAMKPELLRDAPVNTQGNLNVERIGSMDIAVPRLLEQKEIVLHVERRDTNLNNAVEIAICEIALATEYRTRLIADVVTGKLDVREAAAVLPHEADEEPDDSELGEELDEELEMVAEEVEA